VPGVIVGLQVEVVEDIEHRVGVLEAAELVQLAVTYAQHEVASAASVDHPVDGVVDRVIELQNVPICRYGRLNIDSEFVLPLIVARYLRRKTKGTPSLLISPKLASAKAAPISEMPSLVADIPVSPPMKAV
jgi:hypothetical protein